MESTAIFRGLEGVSFSESSICKVDGVNGKLYYRGYSIEELAENSTFEEVCYLLLYGKLPKKAELSSFTKRLIAERELNDETINIIKKMRKKAAPMDTLRTAVSMLPAYDGDAYGNSEESNIRKSISLISKIGSITAVIGNGSYIEPNPELSHAANFLYMLKGKVPSENDSKTLDLMMLLHAEHSSNASTFSALVTGSTLADIYAAITSAIATLKGPLHGGADEAALRMMEKIGKPEKTEDYINKALEGKERIMGFGHRVYKAYDPRARIIRKELERLQKSSSNKVRNLTGIAFHAERMMIERLGKTKGIWPNVDFFSGPVYTSIGIPAGIFTPLFAVSRIPGWCAHLLEYWKNNRLLRPLETYVGKLDLKYVPIGKR